MSSLLSGDSVKVEDAEALQACRICLSWDVKLYSIHEWGLNDMYGDLTGTTPSLWDGWPQHLCAWCRAQLLKAHALRSRSRRADALLKHQQYITNSFIRSIDRSLHKITHTLSTKHLKDDATYYFDSDTQTDSYNLNLIGNNEKTNDVVDNDEKEFELIDDVKNYDFQNDSSSDLDTDKFKVMDNSINDNYDKLKDNISSKDANLNLAEEEIFKDLDSHIKRGKTKKKRLAKRKNGMKSEVSDNAKLVEPCLGKEIREIGRNHRKRRIRKSSKEKETVKVARKRQSKQKFCTEEDFKEFEKKYDFQVLCLTEEEMQNEMQMKKESDKYLKGEYKCELCYKGFLTSATFENHMKTHDPARGPHSCALCRVRYPFPVKLRQHVQNAHRLKFRCARCNELVRGKACAILHAAYHAGTTFQCAHCDKQFLKKTSRTSHMRMAHPVENAAGGTCEVCGETFTSRTGLKAHKTRSHKKANLPEHKCRKCRIQFDNMAALQRHKQMYADNKCDSTLSACEQCGETCASADDLIQHQHTRHEVELFTCDTCTKSFTSKASLATHMDRIHRRIRPPKADYSDGGRRKQPDWLHWASVCEHCGKRLSCLATLKIHMNKHTGERPYKCPLCPKAYMTPYGLNNHQASHTGVRKWQCPECPATFMHQSSVYQHRKIHTGERSHQCTICDKYFTQSGSLYTHVKYVHRKETPPPRKRNKKPVQ